MGCASKQVILTVVFMLFGSIDASAGNSFGRGTFGRGCGVLSNCESQCSPVIDAWRRVQRFGNN